MGQIYLHYFCAIKPSRLSNSMWRGDRGDLVPGWCRLVYNYLFSCRQLISQTHQTHHNNPPVQGWIKYRQSLLPPAPSQNERSNLQSTPSPSPTSCQPPPSTTSSWTRPPTWRSTCDGPTSRERSSGLLSSPISWR